MRFTHPGWLAVGVVACALLLGLWRFADARQHRALAGFIAAHLRTQLTQSISVARRRARRGLFLAAVALLCVALAGPLFGYRWEQITRRGNEIVFAIDTSRSMSSPDMKPDRLTRAKLAIDDFANALDGDAVGIVAFAGSAFLVCPITLDYGAFHESLSALDTNTIARGGTNISSAIHEAQSALRRRPGSDKILILVTDGEDLEGNALLAARTAAQQDGLKIFTVGVGTPSGELIPVPPDQGGGFVKDESGQLVKSRLDEAALQAIAAATGGSYVPLGLQGEGLDTLLKSALGPLAKHDLASRRQKIYTERYQWPLAASLGALLATLLIGTRRRATARQRLPPHPTPAAKPTATSGVTATSRVTATSHVPAAVLLLLMISSAHPARAAAPSAPLVDYNAGTSAYRAAEFPRAADAFQRSISHTPSNDPERLADQEDAYYNLGNTLYRAGQKTAESTPKETLQKWNDAVKAYETALQLRAADADAKFNRDLVKRKIAALQQQQQQQNQSQNQQQKPQQKPGQNPQQNQGAGQKQAGQQPGQPPPQAGQPPGQQPGQPPGQPPGQQPGRNPPQPGGQPPAKPPGDPEDSENQTRSADNQRLPGQMSREEARELLDSVKADERRPPGSPLARRTADDAPPEPPIKDW